MAPGYPGAYVPGAPMPKSRTTAGILGILLGGFGVHRFYLGYTSIGLLQILVTLLTCGVGSVWGLVEGILILVKNENFLTDANGTPLID
jgi:TM2 domain-containing membrane protein YozV